MAVNWSRAVPCIPKDNMTTEAGKRAENKSFLASYENDNCPPPMALLIGWEYARIWKREHDAFVKDCKKSMKKPKYNNVKNKN
ncbi:uncharacterized protein Dwil_GK26997 [Drosophila willistoni]|uniref:Uncharacterized protein n=1 Tax=Drosophila willistoni TaxID=7260 RepID=A0A0Q9X2V5_DROWI|nr:uncharacterized protein Dwil_GK26997 [Drosophila willistoni]